MTCKPMMYCKLLYYVSFVLFYMKLSLERFLKNCNVKLDHRIVFFWCRCGFSFYYCSNSKYEYNDDVTKCT